MDSAVVKYLINNILSVLATEASLLWGVHDAIGDIKDELISMQSLLVDADKKGTNNEGEKTWVANVRDMAYELKMLLISSCIKSLANELGVDLPGSFTTQFIFHGIYG